MHRRHTRGGAYRYISVPETPITLPTGVWIEYPSTRIVSSTSAGHATVYVRGEYGWECMRAAGQDGRGIRIALGTEKTSSRQTGFFFTSGGGESPALLETSSNVHHRTPSQVAA